ncbi:MAG: 4-alpha-glucanotransferase [Gammaproteobacteria bacterium]|nr:4-alpha-glucanotransferase [Gammaproteobacteria bacterium]
MVADENSARTGLPEGRFAGVCLHLSSLPGIYGIGEIGDSAREFIDRMKKMRLGVWQFLPTGPTAYGDSPYQPLSSFAGNEMLIDIASLIRSGLITSLEADSLIDLPQEFVDYSRLIPKKDALLTRAARRFHAQADAPLIQAYQAFLDEHDRPWLHDYALYRILKTRHDQRPWCEWEEQYRRRDAAALQQVERDQAPDLEAVKIIQFLFDQQWSALRAYAARNQVILFGDMPIYIALDSADAWAHPEILRIDRLGRPTHVAGVPPDYFSEDGQLWGNPLYDWDYHAASGYGWWIERMRAALRLVDIVRIDHFRGFESFWEVPYGAQTARGGRWVPGPGDGIFDALRAAFGELAIVAEDLGVITPEVEGLRDRHRLPGMAVLQFEVGGESFALEDVRSNCVCYTGTHDNDTTVGWFMGSPDDNRKQEEILRTQEMVLAKTGGNADSVASDLIQMAFSSEARMAIVPMQDYLGLGSEARLNRPGSSSENWRWRLLSEQITPALCQWVSQMVGASGRQPGK